MINYRNATKDDLFSILELGYRSGIEYPIEGYKVDQAKWTKQVIAWLEASLKQQVYFKLAFINDYLSGFVIGVPTVWHYSDDVYLELKEVLVNENLPLSKKAVVIKRLVELAESDAKNVGLKGMSAFSIRPNSTLFSNFFCRKLGWTSASGAKKIF